MRVSCETEPRVALTLSLTRVGRGNELVLTHSAALLRQHLDGAPNAPAISSFWDFFPSPIEALKSFIIGRVERWRAGAREFLMRRSIQLLLVIGLLFLPQTVTAWGASGHRIVGDIAFYYLTPKAKAALGEIQGKPLKAHHLADWSTWADEIKSDPVWSPRGERVSSSDWTDPANHRNWHWGTAPDPNADLTFLLKPSEDRNDGFLVAKIKRCEAILRGQEAGNKLEAAKFLTHFIGDLHQPMHVGNGKDRGGNQVDVAWFRENTNLHSVWDSKIIEHRGLSYTEYSERLRDEIRAEDLNQWQTLDILTWVRESVEAREVIYKTLPSGDRPNLSWNYAYDHLPTTNLRLKQAGVRLAHVFNNIYN